MTLERGERALIYYGSHDDSPLKRPTPTANANKLARSSSLGDVFEMVKRAVEGSLGMHRAGLTLVLGDIPNNVGAYHELGSNAIVMNRNIIKVVWKTTSSRQMRNSYAFMVLLHEYLHTLGFTDDAEVRELGRRVANEYLGEGHLAAEMAVKSLDKFFPEIPKFALLRDKGEYETIRRFDTSSTSYIA